MTTEVPPHTVKNFLVRHIDSLVQSGEKTQRQIAVECGYDGARSNIISMFKQGTTRLPINKVGPMAAALNVNPLHLLRLVMSEYSPETWAVLNELMGQERMLSAGEKVFIDEIRKTSKGVDVQPKTVSERQALRDLVIAIADRMNAEMHTAANR